MDQLPKRSENYSEWYNELVAKAQLAEHSEVRGCMIIKPYGYAIWENMQAELDKQFKKTGHVNAYFPLLIPKSYLGKEAAHIEGFAKECAVVTHYRLKVDDTQSLVVDPQAKLEEELIIRPTSETIIWNTYKKWIQSYRDLPILLNQWANVMRWEMRTRLFLRTSEFLWQEGHTAHASAQEAMQEAEKMLEVYRNFAQDFLAIPVVAGKKTASERFAGADETFCIEAMMQDGKALQAGTSHFLGQNFAKAFEVKFADKNGQQEYVWATSWGVSTRLMGALIMTHSDDAGLVLPPKVAPMQVVIVPIFNNEAQLQKVLDYLTPLLAILEEKNIRLHIDKDDQKRMGWKFAEYELRGVPLRIAVGEKDIAKGQLEIFRRDTLEKKSIALNQASEVIASLLSDIQTNLYQKAQQRLLDNTVLADDFNTFETALNEGKFVLAHWDGTAATEEKIKELTKATIRCIPLEDNFLSFERSSGKCVFTQQPSAQRVLFARAY